MESVQTCVTSSEGIHLIVKVVCHVIENSQNFRKVAENYQDLP